ncbi:MAG: PilZ domain-containing protein [Candidatus Omnitrophica bacterium]|nr:PilZ domain-containing protein [Candidatus Omnitrophota bacterium]
MPHERRRFPRVPESFQVQYRVFGELDACWMAATTVNISAGGIRFRGSDELDVGAPIEVKMPVPGIAQPLLVRGVVIWAEVQAPGVVEHGIQLSEVTLAQQAQIDRLVQFLRSHP